MNSAFKKQRCLLNTLPRGLEGSIESAAERTLSLKTPIFSEIDACGPLRNSSADGIMKMLTLLGRKRRRLYTTNLYSTQNRTRQPHELQSTSKMISLPYAPPRPCAPFPPQAKPQPSSPPPPPQQPSTASQQEHSPSSQSQQQLHQ